MANIIQTKRFEAVTRGALTLLALLGGFIALGGQAGPKEAGLVLACVGLNELRLRLRLERSNARMLAFWACLFGAAPVLYLLLHLPGLDSQTRNMFEKVLQAPVIVALALPFQVFAAYVPSLPRAHHLVYAFVLVECVLGARQDVLDPLWPWLLAVLLLMSACLMFSYAAIATKPGKNKGSWRASHASPGELLRPGMLAPLAISVLWVALGVAAIFIALPRLALTRVAADATTAGPGAGLAGTYDPGGAALGDGRLPPFPGRSPGGGAPDGAHDGGVSGLSRSVGLGQFGPLLRDPTPIGKVKMQAPEGATLAPIHLKRPLLLKAYTFDRFDGSAWGPAGRGQWTPVAVGDDLLELLDGPVPEHDDLVRLTIEYDHPQHTQPYALTLPYARARVTAILDQSGTSAALTMRYDDSRDVLEARLTRDGAMISGVQAECIIPTRVSTGPAEPYQKNERYAQLTALPAGLAAALEDRWPEREQFARLALTPRRLAERLEQWFQSPDNFQYSLDRRPEGPDAITRFICDPHSRTGHCEYFASAMVLALRSFGVPARLCVGYMPTQLVPGAPEWSIRQSSAHAWIEAFFPGTGWRTFNPTAGERHEGGDAMAAPPPASNDPRANARNNMPKEETPFVMNDPVKDFSDEARRRLFGGIAGGLGSVGDALRQLRDLPFDLLPEAIRPKQSWLRGMILIGAGVLIALPLVMRLRRKLGVRELLRAGILRADVRIGPPSDLYTELLRMLAERGFERRPHQTPSEFARAVVQMGGERYRGIEQVTALFYGLRYGTDGVSGGNDALKAYRGALKDLAAHTREDARARDGGARRTAAG